MEITNCISFTDYLEMSKSVTDKVGFLTLVFRRLHTNAPKEDELNLGGRIAQLWVLTHRDTGRLLEIIWVSSARNCNGSHLNFIQAMLKKPVDKIINNQTQYPVTKLKRAN